MTPELRARVVELLRAHRNNVSAVLRQLAEDSEAATPGTWSDHELPPSRAAVTAVAGELGADLHPGRPPGPGKKYSARRPLVLQKLAEGKKVEEVARELGISHQAVYLLRKPVEASAAAAAAPPADEPGDRSAGDEP